MGGAFLMSRSVFQNGIWDDVVKFRLFFYLVGHAVFKEEGIEVAGIKVERGQYLRSMRQIQNDLSYKEGRGNAIKEYPLTTIQRKIKSLVNEERIEVKSTEYGTLFTIVNYSQYQAFDNYKKGSVEQLRNSDGTATEQQRNNKNYEELSSKNEKNEKNKDRPDVFQSKEEIEVFVDDVISGYEKGINKKLLVNYFDCIRNTRSTGKVSANVLKNLSDKLKAYSKIKLDYSLYTHYTAHEEKGEKYTLGILRQTTEDEADAKLKMIASGGGKKNPYNKPVAPVYKEVEDNERANRKDNEQDTSKVGDVKLFR